VSETLHKEGKRKKSKKKTKSHHKAEIAMENLDAMRPEDAAGVNEEVEGEIMTEKKRKASELPPDEQQEKKKRKNKKKKKKQHASSD